MAGGGAVATLGEITRMPVLGACVAQAVAVHVAQVPLLARLEAVSDRAVADEVLYGDGRTITRYGIGQCFGCAELSAVRT